MILLKDIAASIDAAGGEPDPHADDQDPAPS
jgi:hypothetical protein